MANTYCYKGYCDGAHEEGKIKLLDKFLIAGGYILAMLVLSALVLFGASQGIYIDPALLP
ncbi:hypothetical protein [Sporomusa malonica]|uniref:Uncharacterized protein n=1 Tax=Sporomusa malonica TaxID=112901 RepID=A0A1W2A8I3_9FIRM|nr:hypothetical protein [Sporomusa malonica]SMC56782.1 hypothetical protein SAMN04488500_105142 [Sporomusa malonica]